MVRQIATQPSQTLDVSNEINLEGCSFSSETTARRNAPFFITAMAAVLSSCSKEETLSPQAAQVLIAESEYKTRARFSEIAKYEVERQLTTELYRHINEEVERQINLRLPQLVKECAAKCNPEIDRLVNEAMPLVKFEIADAVTKSLSRKALEQLKVKDATFVASKYVEPEYLKVRQMRDTAARIEGPDTVGSGTI